MKYEVYHRDTLEGISYHETILEALGEYEAHHQAGRIARRENYAEFLGWTI